MHVKRFEAPTMLEAIRQVKAELGPEAVIVSQRTVKRRGAFGMLGRGVVEVTAAVDRDVRPAAPEPRVSAEPASEVAAPDRSWQELAVQRAIQQPLESEVRALRTLVEQLTHALPDSDALQREVGALRRAAADAARDVAPLRAGAPASVSELLRVGIAPRHAHAIAGEVEAGSETLLCDVLARHLDRRLVPDREDRPSDALLLVGAAGVGKTTTLAKLAAREQSQGQRPIALATLDAHRLGGDAALRAYAKQAGLPCESVVSADRLGELRRRYPRHRLLVDTPGANGSDREALGELWSAREALGPRTDVRVVLAATTKDDDLARELDRFRGIEPGGLVATKVDESRSLGNLVNLLLDPATPPLAWIGDGPHVPDDLRLPDPQTLAAQVLGANP